MQKKKIVQFECERGHVWNDPFPSKGATVANHFFGICPLCPGEVRGTAKG